MNSLILTSRILQEIEQLCQKINCVFFIFINLQAFLAVQLPSCFILSDIIHRSANILSNITIFLWNGSKLCLSTAVPLVLPRSWDPIWNDVMLENVSAPKPLVESKHRHLGSWPLAVWDDSTVVFKPSFVTKLEKEKKGWKKENRKAYILITDGRQKILDFLCLPTHCRPLDLFVLVWNEDDGPN